ncbi:hypothetical protein BH24ACT12_BH24ACT12_27230 [soil metagenome]
MLALVGLLVAPYLVIQAAAMALLTLGLGTTGARLVWMSEQEWHDRDQAPAQGGPQITPAVERVK